MWRHAPNMGTSVPRDVDAVPFLGDGFLTLRRSALALELLDWTLWMSATQVMVVDDDTGMCEFLRAFLSERGYAVIAVDSAEEAVKRYNASRPAAVILDLRIPGRAR